MNRKTLLFFKLLIIFFYSFLFLSLSMILVSSFLAAFPLGATLNGICNNALSFFIEKNNVNCFLVFHEVLNLLVLLFIAFISCFLLFLICKNNVMREHAIFTLISGVVWIFLTYSEFRNLMVIYFGYMVGVFVFAFIFRDKKIRNSTQ